MKRLLPLLPLVATAGLLAACGDCHDGYCDHGRKHEHKYHHGSSDDALSDRSLGSTRGAHNEKRVGDYNTKDRVEPYPQSGHYYPGHNVAPAYVITPGMTPAESTIPNYRPDGVYYYSPAYEVRGEQHNPSEDALSDRPLGSSRGAHNERMDAKDSNNDGEYDYVPYYAPRRY